MEKKKYEDMIHYYSEYVLKTEEQRIAEKAAQLRKTHQVMAMLGVFSALSTCWNTPTKLSAYDSKQRADRAEF